MTRYYNPDNDPFYTQFSGDDEEDCGRGEIGIEDWQVEEICEEVETLLNLITYTVRMEHEEVLIKRKSKQNKSAEGAATSGLEYLGVKHLTENKESESSKFKILWAGTPEAAGVNNRFNATVAVKVERVASHQRYWWMLSDENPNLEFLLDNIGDDTEKWVGSELLLFVYIEMPSEKRYIQAETAPKASAAKTK